MSRPIDTQAFFDPGTGTITHVKDGETFSIGGFEATAMLVPGHTPADLAYLVDGSVFVGDTLFMPDVGSARADFPGGDARQLCASMRRLLALPPETTMSVCHDCRPATRAARWQTTVAEQKAHNIHVRAGRLPPADENGVSSLRSPLNALPVHG